jgi:hypothetical protein
LVIPYLELVKNNINIQIPCYEQIYIFKKFTVIGQWNPSS